jgi:hypothetical protein
MRRLPVLIAVLCLIGVAIAQASGQADTRLQANKAIARRDTRALLTQLRLPPSAKRSATEPTGDGAALLHPPRITARNAAGVSTWWISGEAPGTLFSYLQAHPPLERGYYQLITEPSTSASTLIFGWQIDGPHLFSQQLQVTIATLAHGQTGIMAQARSVWMVPRPGSERIPAGVRVVDLTLRIGSGAGGMEHQRTHRYVLTARTRVTSLLGEFDSLPIVQPGVFYSCPAMFGHEPLLTMRFMSGAGSTLARAQVNVYPGKHGASGWNSCDPIDFWIGSRRETPLTSQTFVKQIGKLIGANIS